MWPEWLQVEIAEHRCGDTFGGYVWFPEVVPEPVNERWLRGEEDLDEIEWLLDGGVHPLLMAQTIGRAAAAIYRTAKRHERAAVVAAFAAYSTQRTTAAARRATNTNERKAS